MEGGIIKKQPHIQCQCSAKCTRPLIPGTPFCTYHNAHGCPRKSPPGPDAPQYDPDLYNKNEHLRLSHNCMAYAFRVVDMKQIEKCAKTKDCEVPFHSPGIESGKRRLRGEDGKKCFDVIKRTLGDSKGGYPITFTQRPKPGFSKIAVVVAPNWDFHYYSLDSNGHWSHKPGATPVTDKDSNGNPIYDPALAGRYYPARGKGDHPLNYNKFCGYYAIPRDKPLTLSAGGAWRATRRRARSTRKNRTLSRRADRSLKH